MFDMPAKEASEKAIYRDLTKILKGEGFIRLQKSVYVRVVTNLGEVMPYMKRLEKQLPKKGDIIIMTVPIRTFKKIIHLGSGNIPLNVADEVLIL